MYRRFTPRERALGTHGIEDWIENVYRNHELDNEFYNIIEGSPWHAVKKTNSHWKPYPTNDLLQ
jgi:hypothetical protein